MALPFENDRAEVLRAKRAKLSRGISGLPRMSGVASFLADLADSVFELQCQMEDVTLATVASQAQDATPDQKAEVLRLLRTAVPAAQEIFGKVYLAARTDCSSVVEAMSVDEDIPGVSAAQLKAVKDFHAKKTQQKQQESLRIKGLQRQVEAASAAAAKLSGMPQPVPAAKASVLGKDRYPCTACNKVGHWRDDGQCNPADIQANVERLAALLRPCGRLALAAPQPGSSSGKKLLSFLF